MADSGRSPEAAPLSQPSGQAFHNGISGQPPPPQRVTLDALVSIWSERVRGETARTLQCGRLAHRYLVQELETIAGASERRQKRAALLAELTARLAGQGIQQSPSQLGQTIACWHVARLLAGRVEDAEELPIRFLRAFLPLVERDAATEEWFLRPEHADAARRLWRRIRSGQFGQSTRRRYDAPHSLSQEQKP
jgi:hypothetical protein